MIKYVYPHLPSIKTYPFIRIAGSWLANSLFVFARAIVFANDEGLELINPTWFNFDPVAWKLWSKDKRMYLGIFKNVGATYFRKVFILLFGKKIKEKDYRGKNATGDWVEIFYMKGFETLRDKSEIVRGYLKDFLTPNILKAVDSFDFTNKIAVHIRLGDYTPENRMPISYYKQLIEQIHAEKPQYEFLVFSDGSDKELYEILKLPFTQKVYYGSAMSDIWAISSCKALIGSCSTFTDWGGYLGQLPSLLPRKTQYGSFLADSKKEFILDNKPVVPEGFFIWI